MVYQQQDQAAPPMECTRKAIDVELSENYTVVDSEVEAAMDARQAKVCQPSYAIHEYPQMVKLWHPFKALY
jgi:hypothetical protein